MLLCPACGALVREGEGREVCEHDGETLRPALELDGRITTQIGNYVVADLLGRGGMGVVYRAEHRYIGRTVAIKILHDEMAADPIAVERLLQEARAAASIGHPNIVEVTDFGETPDGLLYFVMELVEGLPLDEVLAKEGRLPLLRALTIVNQVGRGIAAAHGKGVVHRDLKPENVMLQARPGRRDIVRRLPDGQFSLTREASWDFVKILDFGGAQLLDGGGVPDGERVLGTPYYMAPEMVGGGTVDHRVDIYALGVLFFEMLTGAVPFHGATPIDVLRAHRDAPVPSPRATHPEAEVSLGADRLIQRAMAKRPEERPPDMNAFLDELRDCFGDERYLRDVEVRILETVRRDEGFGSSRFHAELAQLFAQAPSVASAAAASTERSGAAASSAAPVADAAPTTAPPTPLDLDAGRAELKQAADRDQIFAALCRTFRASFDYVALFTVAGDVATARMSLGGEWGDRAALAQVTISLALPSAARLVVDGAAPYVGRLGVDAPVEQALTALGRTAPCWGLLVPIVIRHRTVALLYADAGGRSLGAERVSELLPIASSAAQRFQRILLERGKHPR